MNKLKSARPFAMALLLALCSGFCIQGAPTYTFTLTGVNGNYLAGVYTSPYFATITSSDGPNLIGVPVICDDFATDSYVGQSFTATVTTVAALNAQSTVKFDQGNAAKQHEDYATAAFLAQEIVAQDQNNPQGLYQAQVLSFALWGLFDPAALLTLDSNHQSAATSALQYAKDNSGSYTQYNNVQVWTPSEQRVSQEFLRVTPPAMPEPSSLGALFADSIALTGVVILMRRRKKNS